MFSALAIHQVPGEFEIISVHWFIPGDAGCSWSGLVCSHCTKAADVWFLTFNQEPCLSHDDVEPMASPGVPKTSAAVKTSFQRPDIAGLFLN